MNVYHILVVLDLAPYLTERVCLVKVNRYFHLKNVNLKPWCTDIKEKIDKKCHMIRETWDFLLT